MFDPASLRASDHAATTLSFDLGARRWERAEAYGATLLETDVIDTEGQARRRHVLPGAGFGTAQDARPELGVLESFRWLNRRDGDGEIVVDRAGVHVIVLRFRAWQIGLVATLGVDGRSVARRSLPAHGHAREVEVRLAVPMRGGRQRLTIHVDGGKAETGFLLLTGWFVEEDAGRRAEGATDPIASLAEPEWRPEGEGGEAALLVRAPYTGMIVLQLLAEGDRWAASILRVNDGPAVELRSSGSRDTRYVVYLRHGLNRIAPAAGDYPASWQVGIQALALWPARETLATIGRPAFP